MAKQVINIGSSANDGSGTSIRAGGDLINDNFNEIYTKFGDGSTLGNAVIPHKIGGTNFTQSLIVGHSTTGTLNSANNNNALGHAALDAITSGDANTAMGSFALTSATIGTSNVAIGFDSLGDVTGGSSNTAVGYEAGKLIQGGDWNVVIGKNSGDNITSGDGNVIIGNNLDAASATGNSTLKIGTNATAGGANGTDVIWLTGDSSGNLTTVGNVTLANNKKVIFGDAAENISGDGTDLTIASSGDIFLDATGNEVKIKNAGTELTRFVNSSQNLQIKNPNQDKDITIQGNDGGSNVDALIFDMSDGGAATFNDKVVLGTSKKIEFGDAGENILGNGTDLTIASSRHVLIDATSSIILDADAGDVMLKDGGTQFAHLKKIGNNLDIKSSISDGDITFRGNDGGSDVTALTLDMSDAGAATFGGAVTVTGNLTVNGTTTTVNSTNTTIDDNLLELNSGASSNANDSGIIIERGSTGDNAIIMWDESADKFTLGTTTATADSTGNISVTTGTLVANIEGNITGNISTATALATGRTIGMTGDVVWTSASFDGSGNVTGTAALQANTVSSTELVSATTLLILDSSGSTLKTIIGAGS